MSDFVQPIRHVPVAPPVAHQDGRGKKEPFSLIEEPPPEQAADDEDAHSPESKHLQERDVGHKPDDEEGATLDVTG